MLLKQSTGRNRGVLMVSSTDHLSGKTGLTLTITASKNGGAFATITPTVTDLGSGWYDLALTSAHTDTLGDLRIHVTGAGADPTDFDDQVVLDLPGASVASVTAAVDILQAAADKVWGTTSRTITGTAAGALIAASFAAGAIDAVALDTTAVNEIRDAILAAVIEGSITLQQALMLHNAALGGKSSGHAAGSPVYRNPADTKNRITATTDVDGNRTAVTLDLT